MLPLFLLCAADFSENEESEEVFVKGFRLSSFCRKAHSCDQEIPCSKVDLSRGEIKRLSFLLHKLCKNRPLSFELLQEIKQAVAAFYSQRGYPFVMVRVPEQDITDGIVHLRIEESRLDKVSIEGACWFSSAWYLSQIQRDSGDCLSMTALQEDLSWINRNSFRSAEAICKRGKEPMTTDIDLIIKDRRPLRAFVGTDNTGFKETGYQRAFAGAYFGNLFSLGQIFSYQYTTDYDIKRFQSHIGFYEIPFPWRHLLSFFGGASFVRVPVEDAMFSRGDTFQASTRYTIPFAQGGKFPQEVRFGCDFKRMNTNVTFGGQTVAAKNVDLFQLAAEYKLSFVSRSVQSFFSLEAILSPGPLLPDMQSSLFNLLRTGAGPNYFYVRGCFKQLYRLPKECSLAMESSFQLATNKLLASEQFGLGGYTTVRGYQERAVNADNAFLLRLESRFPAVSLPWNKNGSLVFFCFSDFGVGADQLKLESNFRNTQTLWGVGPGFRYTYKGNVALRFDWGYQLTNIQNNPAGHNRVNFGATFTL
jgi:hemolysin activation/secretion protein